MPPLHWFFIASLLLSCMHAAASESSHEIASAMMMIPARALNQHIDFYGFGSTIPAAPVQSQASSCSFDLNDQLLGGLSTACMIGVMDRKRCCPVLAAWLMAARSKVALQPPLPEEPGMPLLPDDSLVCIASMKAALESRGFYLTAPNDTCDVVACFCGIRLNEITVSSCPLTFWSNTSSVQPKSSSANNSVSSNIVPIEPSESNEHLPLEPSDPNDNGNSTMPVPSVSTNGSSLFLGLAANCTDHSYTGCTKCLRTLLKEVTSTSARKSGVSNSSVEIMHCELIGLMWLLDKNKTFYIPTVSAVLRALMFNEHPTRGPKCSSDAANMPLAVDYSEILLSRAHSVVPAQNWICYVIVVALLLIH